MPKVQRIEIVPARTKGITGYVNVGRGTVFGNPFVVGSYAQHPSGAFAYNPADAADVVKCFIYLLNVAKTLTAEDLRRNLLDLLDRDTPDGTLTIACPCNNTFKGQPCHATVIKSFLDAELARRSAGKLPEVTWSEPMTDAEIANHPIGIEIPLKPAELARRNQS